MSLAMNPPPRRLSIRHLMLAVLLTAFALVPIVEMSRQRSIHGVSMVIAVDLIALPVLLVVWNNKIRHDPRRRMRNRLAIWTAMSAGYVALVVWLALNFGHF